MYDIADKRFLELIEKFLKAGIMELESILTANMVHHWEMDLFMGNELYVKIAEELNAGKVIGLFQGRMEFGPRALSNRSIVSDARTESMQVKLNQKMKHWESSDLLHRLC